MKKLLALLLVAVMAVSMIACGSQKEEAAGAEPGVEQEETLQETETQEKEEEAEVSGTPTVAPTQKPTEKPAEKPVKPGTAETPTPTPTQKPTEEPPTGGQKPMEPATAGHILLQNFKANASLDVVSLAEKLVSNEMIPFMAGASEVTPGYLPGFTEEIHNFKKGATFGPMMSAVAFVGYVFELEEGADVSAFISNLQAKADLRWNICVEAEEMVTGSSGNKVFFVMCNRDLNAQPE